MENNGFYVCVMDIKKVLNEMVSEGRIDDSIAEELKRKLLVEQKYMENKNG